MGEKFVQVLLIVGAVILVVSLASFVIKVVWWLALMAGAVVLAGMVLNSWNKD